MNISSVASNVASEAPADVGAMFSDSQGVISQIDSVHQQLAQLEPALQDWLNTSPPGNAVLAAANLGPVPNISAFVNDVRQIATVMSDAERTLMQVQGALASGTEAAVSAALVKLGPQVQQYLQLMSPLVNFVKEDLRLTLSQAAAVAVWPYDNASTIAQGLDLLADLATLGQLVGVLVRQPEVATDAGAFGEIFAAGKATLDAYRPDLYPYGTWKPTLVYDEVGVLLSLACELSNAFYFKGEEKAQEVKNATREFEQAASEFEKFKAGLSAAKSGLQDLEQAANPAVAEGSVLVQKYIALSKLLDASKTLEDAHGADSAAKLAVSRLGGEGSGLLLTVQQLVEFWKNPSSFHPSTSSTTTTTTTTPRSTTTTTTTNGLHPPPPPGNSTPQAAVSGFIGSMLAKNPTVACEYIDDFSCGWNSGAYIIAPRPWFIGSTTVSGSQALVTIVSSNLCVYSDQGDDCLSNSSPVAGQPTGSGGFASAYNAATGSDLADSGNVQTADPAIPLDDFCGKWLVNDSSGQSAC